MFKKKQKKNEHSLLDEMTVRRPSTDTVRAADQTAPTTSRRPKSMERGAKYSRGRRKGRRARPAGGKSIDNCRPSTRACR